MEYTNRTAIATGAASGMGLLFSQNWAEPQEIVDLILFIASDKGQFINGENIMIDGGRNARKRG